VDAERGLEGKLAPSRPRATVTAVPSGWICCGPANSSEAMRRLAIVSGPVALPPKRDSYHALTRVGRDGSTPHDWRVGEEPSDGQIRTLDPFLTMERRRQLVATDGNGFRLFGPSSASRRLPLLATGCNHGAP
jgi:hypothetical protein